MLNCIGPAKGGCNRRRGFMHGPRRFRADQVGLAERPRPLDTTVIHKYTSVKISKSILHLYAMCSTQNVQILSLRSFISSLSIVFFSDFSSFTLSLIRVRKSETGGSAQYPLGRSRDSGLPQRDPRTKRITRVSKPSPYEYTGFTVLLSACTCRVVHVSCSGA